MNERIDYEKIIKQPKRTITRINENLDKAVELVGDISTANTKENRRKLYKAYDILLKVQQDMRKLGDQS